ncbi:MAG: four helix bundle protein [Bacteroidota bacterium]
MKSLWGSANEVQTQLEVACRVKYIEREIAGSLIDETLQIYKMILAFYNSLKDDE